MIILRLKIIISHKFTLSKLLKEGFSSAEKNIHRKQSPFKLIEAQPTLCLSLHCDCVMTSPFPVFSLILGSHTELIRCVRRQITDLVLHRSVFPGVRDPCYLWLVWPRSSSHAMHHRKRLPEAAIESCRPSQSDREHGQVCNAGLGGSIRGGCEITQNYFKERQSYTEIYVNVICVYHCNFF